MFWKGFKTTVLSVLEKLNTVLISMNGYIKQMLNKTSEIENKINFIELEVKKLGAVTQALLDETDYKEPIGFLNSANYYAGRVVTVKDGDGNVTHTGKCYGSGVTLNSIIVDGDTTNTYRKHLIFENKLVHMDSSYSVEILQN